MLALMLTIAITVIMMIMLMEIRITALSQLIIFIVRVIKLNYNIINTVILYWYRVIHKHLTLPKNLKKLIYEVLYIYIYIYIYLLNLLYHSSKFYLFFTFILLLSILT